MPRKKNVPMEPEDQTSQELKQAAPEEGGELWGMPPEGGTQADSTYQEPESSREETSFPSENDPFYVSPADDPVDVPPSGTGGATDPEYDALLHEWSGTDSSHTAESGDEDALTLDPPPGDDPGGSPGPDALGHERAAGDAPHAPGAVSPRRRMATPAAVRRTQERERVLTIEARDEVQTEEDRQAAIWHEIQNADWTRRILTGTLDGVEETPSGITVAIVSYKGFRVAIPIREMLLHNGPFPTGPEYRELMDRLRRILMTRIGCEIDFTIKGHDNKERSAVGSRKDAMYRKRQSFYLDRNELGEPLIYEGRVVQARVVAVSEKIIRVEVFGVECVIVARGLSHAWLGDAAEKYSVGDRILVRVLEIRGSTVEDLAVSVDVRSVSGSGDGQDALKKIVPQGRYAGRVTDIRGGVVYVRLNNGVNAIAHSCYDRRTPGKRDDVSFSVTRLDPEQGVAVGIITRIIKQNL